MNQLKGKREGSRDYMKRRSKGYHVILLSWNKDRS